MWTSRKEALQLKNKIESLDISLKERDEYIKELESLNKVFNSTSFLLEESIPPGETDRKRYVADIAFFYGSSFKVKLEHFIGMQMIELSQIGRTEKGNDIIRANVNCFRLIDEWCEKMTNEHLGNLEGLRNQFEGDDFINKMKETYEI